MYLPSPLRVLYTPHRGLFVVVSYGPAPLMRQLGFLLESRQRQGVPIPYGHSCMVYATACLTVIPSFSDINYVSTIDHSFKPNNRCTPSFHVSQYGDDIIGRELNLDENCPVGSGSRTHNLQKQLKDYSVLSNSAAEAYICSETTSWQTDDRLRLFVFANNDTGSSSLDLRCTNTCHH